MPRFSVIIPTYNHITYVVEAIASVLRQTLQDYELLVVDDGSTDDTAEVVPGRYPDVRFIRQDNQGLSAARNTGLRASRGEVIALLDADDMYEEGFLATMDRLLRRNPKAEAAYCGYGSIDETGHSLPFGSSRVVSPDSLFEALLKGNFLVPACMVATRRAYDTVGGFDTTLRACEDWDMWLRFTKHLTIVGTSERLVRYRMVSQSMSSDPPHMLRYRKAVLDKHCPDSDDPLRDRAYAEANLQTAVEYLQCDKPDEAVSCIVRMAELCPDLLTSDRVFYELACSTQRRGFRGDFRSLDIAESGRVVLSLLQRLCGNGAQTPRQIRSSAYSKAHFALAKLSYGARKLAVARHHLRQALKADFRIIGSPDYRVLLLKSLLGSRILRLIPGSGFRPQ